MGPVFLEVVARVKGEVLVHVRFLSERTATLGVVGGADGGGVGLVFCEWLDSILGLIQCPDDAASLSSLSQSVRYGNADADST